MTDTQNDYSDFIYRHIGLNQTEQEVVLKSFACNSLEDFIESTIPANIQSQRLKLKDKNLL